MDYLVLSLLVVAVAAVAVYLVTNRRTATPTGAILESHKSFAPDPDTAGVDLSAEFFSFLLRNQNPTGAVNRLEKAFNSSWQSLMTDPALFPRQPLVLPKLLNAMRSENGSKVIVDIVSEDPGLTAEVLKLANSPIYRNTKKQIQSIDYALVMLGIDGLQSLICSSLTKPIFAKRRADGFNASVFWEWSLLAAQSSQKLAALNQAPDPTRAYMLTLLTRLAELTILRMCVRLSGEVSTPVTAMNLQPILNRRRYDITTHLVQDWGFESSWLAHLPGANPDLTDPIVHAQYLAGEISSAVVLLKKQKIKVENIEHQLHSQGLSQAHIRELVLTPAAID